MSADMLVQRLRDKNRGWHPDQVEAADQIEALEAEVKRLALDAARYRWLRRRTWYEGQIACVMNPKAAVKLGYDCPSLDRLDAAIDAVITARPEGQT